MHKAKHHRAVSERPVRFVVTDSGCHECISHKPGGNGYPCFTRGGQYQKISRYVYRINFGNIKARNVVMHTCDNPLCINPKHLKQGTQRENNTDKVNKRRHSFGESHGMSKLRVVDVVAARILLSIGYGPAEIARLMRVDATNISSIKNNKTWRHVK